MTATMNQKNSQNSTKKSKDKRLLIGAIIVAIIIIIGATFAWLTSTDTVTNRLTASANYGVAITEKFEPPTIWTPGEEVTKEVSVVNTGNIDAFVHVTFDNTMEFTAEEAGSGTPNNGEIYVDDSTSWVVLTVDEAHAMMAGGFLAYNSNVTKEKIEDGEKTSLYPAIESEASEIEGDPNDYVRYWCDIGGTIYGYSAENNGVSIGEVTTEFRPTGSGYYIFRREVGSSTYEYEGFYVYVTSSEPDINDTAYWDTYEVDDQTYYALYYKIDLSETTLGNFTVGTDGSLFVTSGDSYDFPVMQSKTTEVTPEFGDKIKNDSDGSDGSPAGDYIEATYEDITIRIYLNGTWTSSDGVWTNGDWTAYYDDNDAWHFCYNDDLSAGEMTAELITALYLEDEDNDATWTGFTYDLNVTADSIQVTVNTDNEETYEAWYDAYYENAGWGLVISEDGLTYEEDGQEIKSITWVKLE